MFVIARDGDVHLFKTVSAAAGWVEAIDVEDGEYVGFYRLDGERLDVSVNDDVVRLEPSGVRDVAELSATLRSLAERNGYTGDDPDPVAVANEVFANEWLNRWPRRPKWLDRRLHGNSPPTIAS